MASTTISKEQFEAFEDVRVGGVTNMWDTNMVSTLSGGVISSDDALTIIKQYNQLMEEYPDVRQEN